MANATDKQILEEGWRNGVVKLVGTLDSSDVSLPSVIKLSDFGNNDYGTLWGFRVDEIIFSMSGNLEGRLYWHGNTPKLVSPFSRTGKISVREEGGYQPDPNLSGADGSLDFSTAGFAPGTPQVYSVILHLVKLYK